ncbi:hypothetical protein [Ruminococcus sp. FC2018]|uniref:hypothetical protein n=1 Tax=Ruminococcus sp. FC2018 TaxID=1410617 RepID=UPI0012DEC245|nr:hypothetical protein [Ruminococcus sp. FC2018]
MEKSSPPTPLQKPFIAFSPSGIFDPDNEKVVRGSERVKRKLFSEEIPSAVS